MKAATATTVLVVALAFCCAPLLSAAMRGAERQPTRKQAMTAIGHVAKVDCQKWTECLDNELADGAPLVPGWSEGRCVELLYTLLDLEPAKFTFDDALTAAYMSWQLNHGLLPLVPYVDAYKWFTLGQKRGCEPDPSALARIVARALPARKIVTAAVPRNANCQLWMECFAELAGEPLVPGSVGRCVELLQGLLGMKDLTPVFDRRCIEEVINFEVNHQLPPTPFVDTGLWYVLGKEAGCVLAAAK